MVKNKELLLECVKEFGAPLYVYEESKIESQYLRLKNAFKVNNLEIHYACKALTNISILKILKNLGAGLDSVSIEEVKLGLLAGFAPKDILFTPNGVSLNELKQAKELGVNINIDSIVTLEAFGEAFPNSSVGIRLNPHIMAGGNSKISVGHIDSKFGISIHQLPHLLRVVENSGITIEGLHMHTGSDILDADVFIQAAEVLFNAAENFSSLEYLDFGSGFKVPYKDEDIETDIEDLGVKISKRFNEFCDSYKEKHGKDLTLIFEPGKFLVSEAGHFLVEANSVKTTPSNVFVGVNSGLNHFIRPMFYGAYHKIENLSNPEGRKRVYSVVGYICETDTLGSDRPLNEVREGDILRFANAGAYCFMMASNYNSRLKPAEVLIDKEGKPRLIRKREVFDELIGNQLF